MKEYFRLILVTFIFGISIPAFAASDAYPWAGQYHERDTIENRITVPDGYQRINAGRDSFQYWLNHLPLKREQTAVYLYNGEKKNDQNVHAAVIDIDIGGANLQQCADAVIRLKAEYLYSKGSFQAIHFNFTSGDNATFETWIDGYRPIVSVNNIKWQKQADFDSSYSNFRKYLNTVFMYAGTSSLNQEVQAISNNEMEAGDIFIQAGFPGHAVIVVDMAVHHETGKKIFLLAQSYMPAQNIHILKNPVNKALSPWYEAAFGNELQTPEWTFKKEHLKRFKF